MFLAQGLTVEMRCLLEKWESDHKYTSFAESEKLARNMFYACNERMRLSILKLPFQGPINVSVNFDRQVGQLQRFGWQNCGSEELSLHAVRNSDCS